MRGGDLRVSLTAREHPLRPLISYHTLTPRAGETAGSFIARAGVAVTADSLLYVNGRRAALERELHPSDVVGVISVPAGGDGSDPLQVVLQIAVIAAAVAIPGSLVAAGTLTATQGAILGGVIGVGGALLINAIVGVPELPSLDTPDSVSAAQAFSITGGRNAARLYQPMLVVLGRHKVLPDLAAVPYSLFRGDDQYLYMTYHYGFGDLEISDRKIGTTDLGNFSEVSRDVSVGGQPSNIAGDVFVVTDGFTFKTSDEVLDEAGIPLRRVRVTDLLTSDQINESVTRGLPEDTERVDINLVFQLYRIVASGSNAGKNRIHFMDLRFEWRRPGSGAGQSFNWTTLASFRVSNEDVDQFRRTFSYDIPERNAAGLERSGTLELRVTRTLGSYDWFAGAVSSVTSPAARYALERSKYYKDQMADNVSLTSINCYQPGAVSYAGQVREGVRILATGQLNGVVDTYSAVVEQRLPAAVADFLGVDQAALNNSNPAAIYVFVLFGLTYGGERVFGAGLSAAALDQAGLRAWYAWCESKDLEFNYVVTGEQTLEALMRRVCRAGRATPAVVAGTTLVGVVYDDDAGAVKAVFNQANILRDSFVTEFAPGALADGLEVSFIDPEADWATTVLRVNQAGTSSPERTARVTLEGVTSEDQARREANLLLANNLFHRGQTTFSTDEQGALVQRGDVILLAPPRLTQAGRVVAYDYGSRWLTLDGSSELPAGGRLLLVDDEGATHEFSELVVQDGNRIRAGTGEDMWALLATDEGVDGVVSAGVGVTQIADFTASLTRWAVTARVVDPDAIAALGGAAIFRITFSPTNPDRGIHIISWNNELVPTAIADSGLLGFAFRFSRNGEVLYQTILWLFDLANLETIFDTDIAWPPRGDTGLRPEAQALLDWLANDAPRADMEVDVVVVRFDAGVFGADDGSRLYIADQLIPPAFEFVDEEQTEIVPGTPAGPAQTLSFWGQDNAAHGEVGRATGIPLYQEHSSRLYWHVNGDQTFPSPIAGVTGLAGITGAGTVFQTRPDSWRCRINVQTIGDADFEDDDNRAMVFRITLLNGDSFTGILRFDEEGSDPSEPYIWSLGESPVVEAYRAWSAPQIGTAQNTAATLDFAIVENSAGWAFDVASNDVTLDVPGTPATPDTERTITVQVQRAIPRQITDWKYYIYAEGEQRREKVISVEPRQDGQYQIKTRPFRPEYYAAERSPAAGVDRPLRRATAVLSNPVVAQASFFDAGEYRREVQITFEAGPGYTGATAYGPGGVVLAELAFSTFFKFRLPALFTGEVYEVHIVSHEGHRLAVPVRVVPTPDQDAAFRPVGGAGGAGGAGG